MQAVFVLQKSNYVRFSPQESIFLLNTSSSPIVLFIPFSFFLSLPPSASLHLSVLSLHYYWHMNENGFRITKTKILWISHIHKYSHLSHGTVHNYESYWLFIENTAGYVIFTEYLYVFPAMITMLSLPVCKRIKHQFTHLSPPLALRCLFFYLTKKKISGKTIMQRKRNFNQKDNANIGYINYGSSMPKRWYSTTLLVLLPPPSPFSLCIIEIGVYECTDTALTEGSEWERVDRDKHS